jgi:hypothetical protein
MSSRAKRHASSQSWHLPLSERRELWVARTLHGAVDMVEQVYNEFGIELTTEMRERLEVILARVMRGTWDEAAKFEGELRTSLDMERSIRRRLESELRKHGIPVPTDRMPSEPPESV